MTKLARLILKDSILRALTVGSRQLVQLAMLFYGTYAVGAYEYGIYAYTLSVIFIISLILDFGVSTALLKKIAELSNNTYSQLSYYVNVFVFIVFLFAVINIVFIAFEWSVLIPVISLFMVLTSLNDAYLRGRDNFALMSLISISTLALFAAVVALFHVDNADDLLLILLTYYISTYALSATYFFKQIFFNPKIKFLSRFKFTSSNFLKKNIELFKYSLVIGIAGVGHFLYTRVDIIVLGQFGYFEYITVYDYIDRIYLYLAVPFGIIAQALAPKLIRMDANKRARIYSRAMMLVLVISIAIVTIALVTFHVTKDADFWISESGNMFELVFPIALIMAATIPFKSLAIFQSQAYLIPLGHARLLMNTTLFYGGLNVLLNLLFIIIFGALGIFYSTLVVTAMLFITQFLLYRKIIRVT